MNERDTEAGNGKMATHAGDGGSGAARNADGNVRPAFSTSDGHIPDAFGNAGLAALPPPTPEAFGDPRHRQPNAEREQPQPKKDDQAGHDKKSKDDEQEKNGGGQDKGKKDPDKDKPKKPPFYKRPVLMAILIAVVLVLGVGALLYWLNARQYESTDDAFIDGNVVTISPNVAATVLKVLVNDNWPVKQGQVIVQLDPRDYQAVLNQRQADLEAARGQFAEAQAMVQVDQANLDQAKSGVEVAEANAVNALANFERIRELDEQARSKQQLDQVTADEKSTIAQVDEAKAKVESAEATVVDAQRDVQTAEDQIAVAQANVDQAALNLGYCTIIAPEDGRITRKSVQPGAYVTAGQALLSIVPTDVWVTANYKETQLDMIRPGQSVTVHVDAYPEEDLQGKVDSIQNGSGAEFSLLPPENATGNYVKVVQRVPVKIVFLDGQLANYPHLLAPGLSAEPSIHVQE